MDNYIYRFLLEALQEQNRRQLTKESLKCSDAALLREYASVQVKVHRLAGHTQALQGLSINPWVLDQYGTPLLLAPTRARAQAINDSFPGGPRWTTWDQYCTEALGTRPRLVLCDGDIMSHEFHCWTVATCRGQMQAGHRFSLVECG